MHHFQNEQAGRYRRSSRAGDRRSGSKGESAPVSRRRQSPRRQRECGLGWEPTPFISAGPSPETEADGTQGAVVSRRKDAAPLIIRPCPANPRRVQRDAELTNRVVSQRSLADVPPGRAASVA